MGKVLLPISHVTTALNLRDQNKGHVLVMAILVMTIGMEPKRLVLVQDAMWQCDLLFLNCFLSV